jgi:F-box protein 18 (helicase)
MELTKEQTDIIENKSNCIIEARAGTGKTSTLIEYSLQNQNKNKLYLAFNKSISEEAKVKFKEKRVEKITILTAHALAYKDIIVSQKYIIGYNPNAYGLTKHFKIKGSNLEYKFLNHAIRKFEIFCNSDIDSIDKIKYQDSIDLEASLKFYLEFKNEIDDFAKWIWEDMDSRKLECSHSFYLKKYQLSKPKLNYDIIMLDEAQDASPVILDIFFKQNGLKIMVGDNHQAIYSWRGAINALQLAPEDYQKFYLTESFRFPKYIADQGLEALSFKEGLDPSFDFSKLKLIGRGVKTKIETRAIISRNNVALLRKLIFRKDLYKNVWIEGGLDSLLSTNSGVSIFDIYYLKYHKLDKIKNFFIKKFSNVEELQKFYMDLDDPSINSFVTFLNEIGETLEQKIEDLKTRISDSKMYSDWTFSTIHKAKGNEWDEVEILTPSNFEDGFPIKVPDYKVKTGKGGKVSSVEYSEEEKEKIRKQWIEELNIYYVAITRSKVKLIHDIPWLSDIPWVSQTQTQTQTENEEIESDTNLIEESDSSEINNKVKLEFKDCEIEFENYKDDLQISVRYSSGKSFVLPPIQRSQLDSILKDLLITNDTESL